MADTKKSTKMKTLKEEEAEQEDSAPADPPPPAAVSGKKNEPVEQEEIAGEDETTCGASDILTAQTFQSLGVCDALLDACQALEWKTATQIQASVLPEAFAGRDIIGLAETGSGKTGGKKKLRQLQYTKF
jgi:hypothetical protein